MPLQLPPAIADFIANAPLKRDTLGASPCGVHRFRKGSDVFFLESSAAVSTPTTYSVLREAAVLRWLSGKLKVPEVVMAADTDAAEYMITRTVPGRLLSAPDSEEQAGLMLQEALRQVRAVPIGDCPFDTSVAVWLRELDYMLALALGLVEDDPDLELWPGLETPADVMQRLHATVPLEDLVFSQGNLNDSNVFLDETSDLYFIDLGRGGKADRWLDSAFVHRGLRKAISDRLDELF